nr:hypothetical protein [Tanacetum cinerariifolium]
MLNLLQSLYGGYVWDHVVSCAGSSPLTQTRMADFVLGQPVIDAAQCRREADVDTLLKRIQKFSMTQDIGARIAIHIFNGISFAIAKGVEAQIVSRLPSNLLLVGIFPHNIARPLHGVKLLGEPASVDFDFCNELVVNRVAKTIRLMDAIAKINDPQCELLLLRSYASISRLYYNMRTSPSRVFESA